MHRQFIASRLIVLGLLQAALVGAAPRDQAAEAQMNRAINEQYLATEFKGAEKTLKNTIKQCGTTQCSPSVLARAWMYLGIVQSNALKNTQGARKSFDKAVTVSPSVKLDVELATPETKVLFEKAVSSRPTASQAAASATLEPGVARLGCTLEVTEVETRRPIPISCPIAPESGKTELSYKSPGSPEFTRVTMLPNKGQLVAVIPCKDTMGAGEMFVFATATARGGEKVVARWGTPEEPVRVQLVPDSVEPPPAFRGEQPPARCGGDDACTPGTPGCDAAPAAAATPAQACKTGADCESGSCTNGLCDPPPEEEEAPAGPYPLLDNWIGLHVGFDLAVITGTRMCAQQGYDENFRCYNAQGQLVATNVATMQPWFSSSISNSFQLGTIRLMLSYDRVLDPNWSIGARGGFAFKGSPGGFLPVHVEVMGNYWLRPTTATGIRPYVALGGGVAQADFKIAVVNMPVEGGEQYPYDAYRQMGRAFIKAGGGAVWALSASLGLQLNLNLMYFLPTSGLAVEPSLGAVTGF